MSREPTRAPGDPASYGLGDIRKWDSSSYIHGAQLLFSKEKKELEDRNCPLFL
jgi:hypothetical protein